jgi:ribokinase
MKKKILVIGSINYDLVVFTPRHPAPGETIIGSRFQTFPGGKGANQAVAAARLGGDVQIIGNIGQDGFGEELLENLCINQVDTTCIKRVNDSSGTALITVNADGQNSIVVVPGANATLGKEDIEGLRDTIQSAAVLVVQLEIPLEVVTQAIDIAYTAGLIILLNPAPAMSLPQETLQKVTYLIPNESELALLSGLPTDDLEGCRRAAQVLLSKGCNQIVLTRGDQGAFVFNQTGEIFVPSFKVPVVDTTAAGDAFIGGLAAALADGIDLQIALLRASAAGALAVTKAGAQTSLPDITELDDFLKKHKQEVKTH